MAKQEAGHHRTPAWLGTWGRLFRSCWRPGYRTEILLARERSFPQLGRRQSLGRGVELDALDRIADVAAIENMADVRERTDDEPAFELPQPVLDARAHIFEIERVLVIDPLRVANR